MKKYTQKLLTLFMGIIALLISLPINTAKAAIVYPEYHPQDLINNESLYDEVIALTIEGNESELLPQIDFSKFSLLKEIWLIKTVILDGVIINLDKPITSLNTNDSIINLATIDLNDFNSISLHSTYIIGDKVENPKIHNSNPLNEEYKQNLNNIYGLQTYEEKINNIAKEIYSKSDGTNTDIIRLVTLYVLEHLEYDWYDSYTGLPFYESIIDHEKGVCVHYSNFESRLLNKLGIFAIDIGGCDLTDCMMYTHAWTAVYVNDNWYYIDPTWLDDNDPIEALKSKNYQSSAVVSSLYMIPVNDLSSSYSTERKPDFTMQDSIPIEYRFSKISILDEILPNNEDSNDENGNDEILNPSSDDESIKVPDTGLFTSDNNLAAINIISIILATTMTIVILLTTIINRIIRKIKIDNL